MSFDRPVLAGICPLLRNHELGVRLINELSTLVEITLEVSRMCVIGLKYHGRNKHESLSKCKAIVFRRRKFLFLWRETVPIIVNISPVFPAGMSKLV